jgi:polyhydroxyalkanoate synthesis regulator phasin
MVLDGLRGYLQLANGLTDVTRERAMQVAKSLVAQGAVLPDSLKTQVGSLTEDLIATSKANRALLLGLVGSEVERATARFGLAMKGELEAAKRRAQRLEQRVADLEREVRGTEGASAPSATTAPSAEPAPKKATKKAPARTRKTAAKKRPAKKTPAKKTAADTTSAGTSPAETAADTTPADTTPSDTTSAQTTT